MAAVPDQFRAVAQAAIAVERCHPVLRGGDRGSHWCGDRDPDRELGVDAVTAQAAQVSEEFVAAAGRVGPDEDRAAVPIRVRDLPQSVAQDGDVIGGSIRSGVTRPQNPGQGLTGRVEETQQRVIAERALPGRRCCFLLRVRQHDRRVDVQYEPRQRLPENLGHG